MLNHSVINKNILTVCSLFSLCLSQSWHQSHYTSSSYPQVFASGGSGPTGCISGGQCSKTTSTSIFGDGRISTHADLMSTHCEIFYKRRISSVKFMSAHVYAIIYINVVDSSNYGLLGKQSSPKWEIPCPECWWTTTQNLTPLALSSVEKSVTIQIHKKQTNNKKQ